MNNVESVHIRFLIDQEVDAVCENIIRKKGLKHGDISPEEAAAVDTALNNLSQALANWINRLEYTDNKTKLEKITSYVQGKVNEMFDCDECALTDHQANHLHDIENYIDGVM